MTVAITSIPVPASLPTSMNSFQSLYCEAEHCLETDFIRRVFWRCVPLHAIPAVLVLGGWRSDFFAADRELIASAGRATNLHQLRAEIADYFLDAGNRGWLRRRASIRVSTTRLQRLARRHVGSSQTTSPLAAAAGPV